MVDKGKAFVITCGISWPMNSGLLRNEIGREHTNIPEDSMSPHGLLVNLLSCPVGVDPTNLRFSWIVPVLSESALQVSFRVQFSLTVFGIETGNDVFWDSGQVQSNRSISVAMDSLRIKHDTLFYWRVCIWDDRGGCSSWSYPQRVVTATVKWCGVPVWHAYPSPWMLIRRRVQIPKSVEAAWVRATARSPELAMQYVYRMYLNGSFIGVGPTRAPEPENESCSHYYDVTKGLHIGTNVLTALCFSRSDDSAFLADLVVIYKDGSREVFGTGETCKVSSADLWRPVRSYIGYPYYQAPQEDIDARGEPVGWLESNYDDSEWGEPVYPGNFSQIRIPQTQNLSIEYIRPASVYNLNPSRIVLDFGREIIGGVSLKVLGISGQSLEVRLGEELCEDGSVKYNLRAGNTYAIHRDKSGWVYKEKWTLRSGEQHLEHWGYRGFRWAEILTDYGSIPLEGCQAFVLRPPWRNDDASFITSSNEFNRVWEMCRYTIAALRSDIYFDTPTRERGPYEGDAIVNQLTEYSTQRSFSLARYTIEFLTKRPTWPTEYRLLIPILAWRDFLATGDASMLSRVYQDLVNAQLTQYIDTDGLVRKPPGQSSHINGDLVDWPMANRDEFEFSEVNTVINAWQAFSFKSLSNIASEIGKNADANAFDALAGSIKESMNKKLFAGRGIYVDGEGTQHKSQHATVFPLAFNITPLDFRKEAAEFIVSLDMRVSVYCSQFLLEALYNAEADEDALKFMTSTNIFSWLHMMDDLNATIAMEAWDPSIKPNTTFSHAWGSSPANIAQSCIAGVKNIAPGAAKLLIFPQPSGLRYFRAKIPTIRGFVLVSYSKTNMVVLDIIVPPNAKALIICSRNILDNKDIECFDVTPATAIHSMRTCPDKYIFDDIRPGRFAICRS